MKSRNIKRMLTAALATALVIGSAVTALADAGVSEGTGSYEGGEMPYPTLSITLPTIPEGTYDYIADPNGLISATSAAHYDGATFNDTTGVFFKTTDAEGDTKAIYTNKSKALEVTNNNAQDVDVTIKLEQKTAGDEGIAYSDTGTFEAEDTAQKLYLAVTDDADSDPQISALSASAAATLTTTVAGNPDNYDPNWTETNGYQYTLKAEDELDEWNKCSYTLTGALNKNATWGDGVIFPTIKVTWSYAEHQDNVAPSIATTAYTMAADTPITVQYSLGVGDLAAESVTSVIWIEKFPSLNLYTNAKYLTPNVEGNSFTLTAATINTMLADDTNESQTIKVTFSDDTVVTLTFNDPA